MWFWYLCLFVLVLFFCWCFDIQEGGPTSGLSKPFREGLLLMTHNFHLSQLFFFLFYICWFIIKHIIKEMDEQPNEKMYRARYVRRSLKLPCPFPWISLPKSPSAHPPETHWTPSFWVLREASLHRQDWLSHWPLVIELNLYSGSSSFKVGGGGWKFHAPITRVVSQATCSYSEVI